MTRKATAKDGAAAIAMLDRERSTTMTTKKSTGYTTELRHCTGSERFGIAPHEAPVSTFPKQRSRKDGLGTMCAEHWKAYVRGLAADRKARVASGEAGTAAAESATKPKATTRRASTAAKPSANADEAAKAEALIAQVDALPADRMVARVGDADVQAAAETATAARMLAY